MPGSSSAAFRAGRWTAAHPRPAPRSPAQRVVHVVRGLVQIADSIRRAIRDGSQSMTIATPQFMVTARGCAPPMPPSPAVSVIVPAAIRRTVSRPRPRTSRRCPAGCPGCRCRSTTRRSILAVHGQAEGLQAAEFLPGAHCGTRLELAMSTRAPIRGCASRRPACRLDQQGLVALEVLQGAHDRVVGGQLRAARPSGRTR